MTAGSTGAVYAVVRLSYQGNQHFLPGDRIDEAIPADVVEACLARGEASRTKPKPDAE